MEKLTEIYADLIEFGETEPAPCFTFDGFKWDGDNSFAEFLSGLQEANKLDKLFAVQNFETIFSGDYVAALRSPLFYTLDTYLSNYPTYRTSVQNIMNSCW
jgi:hypothetical protein